MADAPDRNSTDGIEITEAMIEAGCRASLFYDNEDPKSWEVAAIYRAMEEERRRKAMVRDYRP